MLDPEPIPVEPSTLRLVYGCFPSGVAAVCALVDGQPAGMAASSFTAVSMAPPLVSVCVQTASRTWPTLRQRPYLGVSILAEGQDLACRTLAQRDGDRFENVPWEATIDGAIFVRSSAAWLKCSVHAEMSAGDHTVVLLNIHDMRADPHTAPLVFHGSRFRRLAAV